MIDDPLWCVPADRRGFLRLALATVPGAAAGYCAVTTPTPTLTPSPTPTASPTLSPTATASPPAAPALAPAPAALTTGPRPALVRSFGPNGTHWPSHTPWLGDSAVKTIQVDCSWTAIRTAILSITPAMASAGVHIKVRAGSLPGLGSSSGSRAVLQDVGTAAGTRNVLVSPLQGRGTVRIVGAARLLNVKGVTFARIDGESVLLTNCTRTAWAHAKMTTGFRMTSSWGATTRQCGAYEVVMPNAKADISDPLGYAAGPDSLITDCVWEGCYSAPIFRPAGASDHIDTLQMFGNGSYRGLTVRDTTLFGSLNCALQIGSVRDDDPYRGTRFLTVDHSILTGQPTAIKVRYPRPANTEAPKLGQAINGVGEPGQLFAKDSYMFGSLYRSSWGQVQNTRVAYSNALSNNPVASGAWTYDPALTSWGAAEFNRLTPIPTDQFLASIWK